MHPAETSFYDGAVVIDLSTVEPMIALPFHPSNAYTVKEFIDNANDILGEIEAKGNALLGKESFKLRDREYRPRRNRVRRTQFLLSRRNS